ncbi:STAS domain-containing protein [Actinomycetospora aeridis]|uniref:STAS domain-containing protein n=1 Tax=Actinomycetospora aeridis TaxID=3129231 RepID=A0ABU8N4F8_9PSEU
MTTPRTGGDADARSLRMVADDELHPGLTVAPTQPRRGLVLVRVLGEIDMLTTRHLHETLDGAVATVAGDRDGDATAPDETPSVVCDLEGVTFLGASGLDTLAAVHASAATRDVHLVLVASHRTVVRPLQLTTLDRRITVTPSHPSLSRHVDAGRVTR